MSGRDDSRKRLPSGTVTLLFADIEGSTRLLHTLGRGFAAVRTRLRELVRAAATTHRGHEVDWAGDGVFLVFSGARDAVAAASELQRTLTREPWPEGGAVRLRIGIHTGEPELGDEGYVGMDVVVAARICAAGHGDQILVSRATRDVAGSEPLPGASFSSLGRHRLKDVPNPEQLFQLTGPGLPDSFPPLRTLGGATLPALHHRLVGRAQDLTVIEDLLTRPDVRLVTLTGPGGAGKSRLGLEVAGAAAVDRPVHLVGLAPITDPDLVPTAIAGVLGVREPAEGSLIDAIGDALTGTGTLLVLDNLEHLPTAAAHVRRLLDRTPDITLLVTSRAPLRLSGERVVSLDPLPLDDAAELFAEFAAARGVLLRDDALTSVREICRRLDGLPLAIELVAARLVILPPAQVLDALDDGLALEMEGPIDLPDRQRTLRATIEWSYGLLSDRQRELHEGLAVFAGGCTLADARAVVGGPRFLADLESLVALSLLRSDAADGEVRLSMLETVRAHAVSRLQSEGRFEELRQRHAERFLELAARAEDELAGSRQSDWLARLESDLDNIRAALDWCLSSGRVEDALKAISALGRFWRAHGRVREARRWLSMGLALSNDLPDDVRADALWTTARQATAQGAFEEAVPLLEEAADTFRRLGRSRHAAFALSELGWVVLERGEIEEAEALCNEALALAEESGDVRARSGALRVLSDVFSARDDLPRAIELQEEALALRRTLGDPLLVSDATYHLGVSLFRMGEIDRARLAFGESLSLARGLGEESQKAAALFMIAQLDLFAGELDLAERQVRESLAIYTRVENDRDRAECLVVLAGIATAKKAFKQAARLLGGADALRGDAPLDLYELPVLERFQPELEAALGDRELARLRAEGARLGSGISVREVVSVGSEE
jgi:predicted ATPase/class 3 adenylate cyclase/Flp pilus assembly protein TadD